MGFCGECESGCWETCQPKNRLGHCKRQIQDARKMRIEYEEWLTNKKPSWYRKKFGSSGMADLLSSVIIENFGPDMVLEDIW